MKYSILLFLILSNNLFAQKALNWINYPTVDGISNISEERMRQSKLVEGDVEKIITTSYFTGDDEKVVLEANYSSDGKITSLEETHFDPNSDGGISTHVKLEFNYDGDKIVSENKLTIIEGDLIEDLKERWPEYYPILKEPSLRDGNGNIVQIDMFADTTHSFYDEYSRKVMDSIPSYSEDGRKITYRYEGNRIYREFYFMEETEENLYQKEEYTIDEYGNWIELKFFGTFALEGQEWTQICTREIVYR